MKRSEEILKQAVKEQSQLYQPPEWRAGFISGAKWADEHPKEGLVNPKDACDMQWLPIDRDENGFATEECLEKIFNNLPCAVCSQTEGGYKYYNFVNEYLDMWHNREDIRTNTGYTHYLLIPRQGV